MIPYKLFTSKLLLVCISLAYITDLPAITVDIYQNMESGDPGDSLTPEIMNASSKGGCDTITATWRFKAGNMMWISDSTARDFPGQILVNGMDYNASGTRTWRFRNKEELEYIVVEFASNLNAATHDRMTVACYYTTYQTDRFSNQHDNIELSCSESFAVLQTIGDTGDDPPYVRAHSCKEEWTTTFSPEIIKVVPGKTYWVNLHYDGIEGKTKVAVFDPDNGWARVGDIAVAQSVKETKVRSYAHFGRCSAHGDWPDNETSTYLDHIMIDYTNAAFPLLPDNVQIKNFDHKNSTKNSQVMIYPNPSHGNCTIQLNKNYHSAAIGKKLRIYDLSGRLVDELSLRNGKFFWENSSISTGTYLMRLKGAKNYLNQRLLLIR